MISTAAFFDVDETLIRMKSMFHFYQYWSAVRGCQKEYEVFMQEFRLALAEGVKRETLNRMYYRQFIGVNIDDIYQVAEDWFHEFLLHKDSYIPAAVDSFQRHKRRGDITVFISGSMLPLLKPLGTKLGVDAILCTQLLLDENGKLTGEIGSPQTIGQGKQHALLSFSDKNKIDLTKSFAYGDDLSDIPMLMATGNPVCIGENSSLAEHARQNKWKVLTDSVYIN
ncbi:HAD family hydrolase [Serratia sp. NPDC078593]|uniref:HAD family hydrolase n=1 Tax=unclassified Serratia (in: enterobacteria) TaxID=2647522 RepID=UPI0037D47F3E